MLTQRDIKRLNRARKTLLEIQNRCKDNRRFPAGSYPDGFSYGKVDEAADMAETAIFNLLNLINAHCITELSDNDLHIREEVEV